jgi:hypothetical protein
MAALPESIAIMSVVAAAVSLIIHWRLANQSGSGFFAYCLLIAMAIVAATTAAALASACPIAQAVADAGILLAGALAFAASGWLLFAFGIAGDTSDH